MRGAHSGATPIRTEYDFLVEIGSDQLDFRAAVERDLHRQHGRKANDVVPPEDRLDSGQISFFQECAFAGGFKVHATHADVEGVLLRVDNDVGDVAAQL